MVHRTRCKAFVFAVFLLSLLLSLLTKPALGQDATAKILGQVTDSVGALIANASIVVTNTATGVQNKTQSNKNGEYQVQQLPIGTYKVQAAMTGFATTTTPEYKLEINQAKRVDFKLPVEGNTQSVDVSVQAAAVDTVTSTIGGSVTDRPLVDLPLNGRNILDLARLMPGVTDSTNPGNSSAGSFSVAGGRSDSVTFVLDGGNNNSLLSNSVVFNPNPDAVEEFRIVENNYSAEYGRNGGGVISVVTKSGTRTLHGSAFEFVRNRYFNANSYFNKQTSTPTDDLKRNQFGGTLGGEIFIPHVLPRKNKDFFFVSYEGQRLTQGTNLGKEQVATTAEVKNGDFSHASASGGPDPAVVQYLQDNPYFQPVVAKRAQAIIDPTRFDPVAKKYLAAGLLPYSDSGFVTSVGTTTSNFDQFNGKFDFVITDKDRLTVSLARNKAPSISPFAGGATTPYPVLNQDLVHLANVAYTRAFTANVLNEFRFVAQRLNHSQAVPTKKLPTAAELGIGITPDDPTGPPRLYFYDSNVTSGFSPQGPTTEIDNTFAYSDNVNWVKGAHSFKFGAYFSPYQNNTVYDFYVNGEFDMYGMANTSSPDIGNATGFAEFLTGAPDEYYQFGRAPSNIRSKNTAVFAQDDWHLLKNLTVNFGLRYEYASPKIDTQGRSFSLVAGQQSTRFSNAPKGLLFPDDKNAPMGANFPDKNDFAPRVGFALDLNGKGKTVVRGGFGVFYDILKGEDNLQFNGQAPFFGYTDFNFDNPVGTTSAALTNFSDPFGTTGNVNPFPSKPPASNIDFGASGFLPFGGGGVYFVDPHLRTPYTMQYNLGVQQDLGGRMTAEIAYVASLSRKYTSLTDTNPFVLGTTKRVYDQVNGVASGTYSYLDTFRNATSENYNSLQASVRKQSSHWKYVGNTYFTLAYTFAKNMDNVSGFRERNSRVPYYNPNLFYAPSDLDVKHRIVFSGGWDLPFDEYLSSVPKFLTKGWSLYPIASWQSGFPLDVTANLPRSRTRPGPSGAGDSELVRVNLVGSKVNILDPYTNGGAYISSTNFNRTGLVNTAGVTPKTPTYGTLGRNVFRGPGHPNVDMSVSKVTQILAHGDHAVTFELRGDFFNLLNMTEFKPPNTTYGTGNFGLITTTFDPRIIQVAGKLHF